MSDAKQVYKDTDLASVTYINNCTESVRFANEPYKDAHNRFCSSFAEIGWSTVVRDIIATVRSAKPSVGYSAIHLRAGDIVTGDWRQFVPVTKYLPNAFVEFALEKLGAAERKQVVLATDNHRYASQLKQRFKNLASPHQFYPNYFDLTECQQAIVDIVVMSEAQYLIAPQQSSFSALPAHLKGRPVSSIDDLLTADEAQSLIHERILNSDTSDVSAEILGRDLCWFLDVFSDDLSTQERLSLSDHAVQLAPDFCGALTRRALFSALAGDHQEAKQSVTRACEEAANASRHDDPMLETLATSICLYALDLYPKLSDRERSRNLMALKSLFHRVSKLNLKPRKEVKAKEDLLICQSLKALQIHQNLVIQNLRFQISAKSELDRLHVANKSLVRKAISKVQNDSHFLKSWRPPAFSDLKTKATFPQVLRNIEIPTLQLTHVLAQLFSLDDVHSSATIHLERTFVHHTGVRWASGWAFDADNVTEPKCLGVRCNAEIVAATSICLPRPDVRDSLKDKRIPVNCGFVIPIPMSLGAQVKDLLCVVSSSR